MFQVPNSVTAQYQKLYDLMDKNPSSLSVSPTDAARVMGMDVECLKMSAYLGKCPFAIGGDSGPYTQRFTKIPKDVYKRQIEEVITSPTRNRVARKGTWVRIPPSPPLFANIHVNEALAFFIFNTIF